jgi:hypothetical protein
MSLADQLPPSLNLPPHLSAHKYLLVCTLTVAAWDFLVLSPRAWRLFRTPEWPALKVLFHFIRTFMPAEFVVVAVGFFDTKWSQTTCRKFYLFEPICTAVLLAATSAVHVIRIHAIYEKNRTVLLGLGALFALQIVVTGVCCAFYHSVPLLDGQGCIAGPKGNWVVVYWVAPTLLYTATLSLALIRSFKSLQAKPTSLWKLMLRDGLNLYGAVWIVNMINVLFWLIITPTGPDDSIKTLVTSMTTVLTGAMTLRIILVVRGTLADGGSYLGTSSSQSGSSRSTHVISTSRSGVVTNPSRIPPTYTLDDMRSKAEPEWHESSDGKSSVLDSKGGVLPVETPGGEGNVGVKITIDREIDYDSAPYPHGR